MARGREWMADEDRLIQEAAELTRTQGRRPLDMAETLAAIKGTGRAARLRDVAERIGRTYRAVRKRASRLEARSDRAHTL